MAADHCSAGSSSCCYCHHFVSECLLASIGWDQTARLWNLDTELPVGPPLKHKDYLSSAAFSAHGKLLATACDNNNAYVWYIHALLKGAGLEDLLPTPDVHAPKDQQNVCTSPHGSSSIDHISQLSQDVADQSFLDADATRDLNELGDADELPPGFFDSTQDHVHVHLCALSTLPHMVPVLNRSLPINNEATELQQPPVPSETRSHTLLGRLSSLLCSRLDTDEATSPQQIPTPSGSRRDAIIGRRSHVPDTLLFGHLFVLPRSQPTTDETTEIQQHSRPSRSPDAVVGRLFSPFRSPPDTNEVVEFQQCSKQTARCSRHVVEVAAIRDKQVSSEKARRIKNPKPRVRVVLFLCCASPGTDDARPSS
ncbi:uncharacterized protein EDB91DRAFT_1169107 [Suillus paluster]|uniref:uncharacterized protein n=1 Tax=Suillus paluster TaxID=48578 RepID=UPI001B872517|nr:uncharacterized protein EDB91DRAFT_1169107 [Suillus paluster]KAG1725286.1 hypothetical protein EDB91DRAFT_1169107 [Suillus paluster]